MLFLKQTCPRAIRPSAAGAGRAAATAALRMAAVLALGAIGHVQPRAAADALSEVVEACLGARPASEELTALAIQARPCDHVHCVWVWSKFVQVPPSPNPSLLLIACMCAWQEVYCNRVPALTNTQHLGSLWLLLGHACVRQELCAW